MNTPLSIADDAGRRDQPMRGIAATLSDQDIADLASYYAGETQK